MPVDFIAGSAEAQRHVREADEVVQRLLSFRRPYEARWDELYRHLVSKGEQKKYPDGSPRANVFVPFPYANVNFVANTVNEALFGMDSPFETYPSGAGDEQAAYYMQMVLDKKALREAHLRRIFNRYIRGLATYGFYALDVGWDWDVDFVYEWQDQVVPPDANTDPRLIGQDPQTGQPLVLNPMTGMPEMRRVQVIVPVPRNRPKFEALDIFDVAIDPDGAYVAKFFDKTVPQMERENKVAQQSGMELYNEQSLARLKMEVYKEGDNERTRNALVRLCELWNATDGTFSLFSTSEDITSLSFKDNRYSYRSATRTGFNRTVASVPKTLLATGYNPYAHCKVPTLYTHYTELPGETFGMGVIEPAYNPTEMYNTSLSMIMDNWNLGVNQGYFYDATRDIDLEGLQTVNAPGDMTGVYGDPSNVLMPKARHTPGAGDYAVLPIFQQIIENTANISNAYQRGVGSPSGNKTATGIQSVIQQANKGMTQLVMQLCEDIIQPLLQMTASNCQQFLPDEVEVRITDQQPMIPKVNSQFLKIAKSDLAGNFDFRIVGAAYMENRFILQNNARMMFETMVKVAPEWVKPETSFLELMKLHRIPYPHRFIRTEQEVQEEKDRAMLMAWLQAIAATRQNEADVAAEQAAAKKNGKGGGRKTTGGPQKPMPTVDQITGAVRAFAQRGGANAMGTAAPPGGGPYG